MPARSVFNNSKNWRNSKNSTRRPIRPKISRTDRGNGPGAVQRDSWETGSIGTTTPRGYDESNPAYSTRFAAVCEQSFVPLPDQHQFKFLPFLYANRGCTARVLDLIDIDVQSAACDLRVVHRINVNGPSHLVCICLQSSNDIHSIHRNLRVCRPLTIGDLHAYFPSNHTSFISNRLQQHYKTQHRLDSWQSWLAQKCIELDSRVVTHLSDNLDWGIQE